MTSVSIKSLYLITNNAKRISKKSTLQKTYTGKKISFQERPDISCELSLPTCKYNYIGETGTHTGTHKDHNGRGHMRHMLKHSNEKNHDNVAQENFEIITKNFKITNRNERYPNHSE